MTSDFFLTEDHTQHQQQQRQRHRKKRRSVSRHAMSTEPREDEPAGTTREAATSAAVASAEATTSKRVKSKRRKQAPREVSSKRPVPMGRDDCMEQCPTTRRGFDPRFEEHCGELREEHVDRNYAFVDGMLARERAELARGAGGGGNGDETALARVDGMIARRDADRRRRQVGASARAEERQAVRDGKQPFFLKKSVLRERELEAKFGELKKAGRVKKFIQNRRRRAAAKERKKLPPKRDS